MVQMSYLAEHRVCRGDLKRKLVETVHGYH